MEKFRRGGRGGVISDPKNFVTKFLALETPKAVWNFSKNSSILVQTGFPKFNDKSDPKNRSKLKDGLKIIDIQD